MAAVQGEHIPLAQGSQLRCVPSDFQCSIWSSVSSFGFPNGLEVLLQPWKFISLRGPGLGARQKGAALHPSGSHSAHFPLPVCNGVV